MGISHGCAGKGRHLIPRALHVEKNKLRSPQSSPYIPPKFNIAPEKWWLEDYFPIGKVSFQVLC